MKKLFLSAVVVAASLFGMTALAQTPQTTGNGDKTKSECPYKKGEGKKDGCRQQKCDASAKCFEGITLSDTQKDQIKALCEKRGQQAQQRREDRAAKAKQGDSIRMAQKRQNLNDMKAILTPEQYVVYLENIVVSAPSDRHGIKDGHKDGKRHDNDRFEGNHQRKGHGDRAQHQSKQQSEKK